MRASIQGLAAAVLAASVLLGSLEAQGRRKGGRGGRGGDVSAVPAPIPKDDAEKLIFEVAEGVPRRMNVPIDDGRLIRVLTEAIGAKKAVELGTSTGYSGLWFAAALRKTGGKLTTFELDGPTAATAREIFEKAGVSDIITIVEGDAHETVASVEGPVDIVFIDADKAGYRNYLEKILPKVRPGGLILAHNIRREADNPPYVEAVTTNPELETLLVSSASGGMMITLKKR